MPARKCSQRSTNSVTSASACLERTARSAEQNTMGTVLRNAGFDRHTSEGRNAMSSVKQQSAPVAGPDNRHVLPQLPYEFGALEPHIDAQTMQIHHGKHHQAYITNLNTALGKHPELLGRSLDELLRSINAVPEDIRTAVRNNAGGHHNHSLFWTIMAPAGHGGGGEPEGALADAIRRTFGDFAKLKELLGTAATSQFGSGWAWLTVVGGTLEIAGRPNQDSPLMDHN